MSLFPIRIGFLRLADSAPVVAAHAFGLFLEEGIEARLCVEPSWANLADKLTWGKLDAAILFPPLALVTAAGYRGRKVALSLAAPLSRGGNMIVLRRLGGAADDEDRAGDLRGAPPGDAAARQATVSVWLQRLGRRPRLAVVHGFSTHMLILRRFLASVGVDPVADVDITIMPPDQIVAAMARGEIDGFCAGPPWGAEACLEGLGFMIGGSSTVMPRHIEKCLVVSQKWLAQYPEGLGALRVAFQRSIDLCNAPDRQQDIARLLALDIGEGGLALPFAATMAVLPCGDQPERMEFCAPQTLAPEDLAWCVDDMQRLDWLSNDQTGDLLLRRSA